MFRSKLWLKNIKYNIFGNILKGSIWTIENYVFNFYKHTLKDKNGSKGPDFFVRIFSQNHFGHQNSLKRLKQRVQIRGYTVENTSMNPKYFMRRYWTIYCRCTNILVFLIITNICSPNIYASFGTFWVKIVQ